MSSVAIAWAVLESGGGATGLGIVFTAGVVSQVVMLPAARSTARRAGEDDARTTGVTAPDLIRPGSRP